MMNRMKHGAARCAASTFHAGHDAIEAIEQFVDVRPAHHERHRAEPRRVA
jgi:hypothetical protein